MDVAKKKKPQKMRASILISLPLFAVCSENSALRNRSLMSPPNEYVKNDIVHLCGNTVRLAAGELRSAVMLETSRNHDPMRDCRWTVTTTGANQTVVVGYASHGLRRSLFSEICLDYVKISHRDRAPIWVCGDDTKSVDVYPHSVNFTLHLNPTWTMESASALVVLYVTAASLPDSMGQCKNGSFFCAVSGICIWDGFICDGVANCLDYDDEHLFYGSTCLMPMLALELIVCGLSMLLVTTFAFCALLRDIVKDYKLASVHMERDPAAKRDAREAKSLDGRCDIPFAGGDDYVLAASKASSGGPSTATATPRTPRTPVNQGLGEKNTGEPMEAERLAASKTVKRRYSVVPKNALANVDVDDEDSRLRV